ncbi:MAG TPA: RecX family transcriptional regulator [Candidatus Saccharimonadales bacterium]|nr:RecX family transcriptional regulator [Candidatus Saccharimonadales bacterium]
MPTITSIEPQKKRKHRFNVFLDGKFAFGINEQVLVENSLRKGMVLEAENLEKVLKKEELTKLQDTAIRFLNYRPRSEKEVRDNLTKKIAQKESIKFQEAQQSPLIEEIIRKLKKYKFINDLEFAKWFVESRIRSHQKSIRVISMELKLKGIEKEVIEKITSSVGNETELAKKAIEKKVKRWQKLSDLDFKKKLYQFLLSRGFDYDTTKETFAYFAKKR